MAACYLLAPIVLWIALMPDRVARSWPHRALTVLVLAAVAFGALVLAVSEWLFWDEFGSRFNFIAVDYLLYTHEVLGNIWQSYPVGKVLLALAVLALAATLALGRRLGSHAGAPLGWRAALVAVGVWAGAVRRHAALGRQRREESSPHATTRTISPATACTSSSPPTTATSSATTGTTPPSRSTKRFPWCARRWARSTRASSA